MWDDLESALKYKLKHVIEIRINSDLKNYWRGIGARALLHASHVHLIFPLKRRAARGARANKGLIIHNLVRQQLINIGAANHARFLPQNPLADIRHVFNKSNLRRRIMKYTTSQYLCNDLLEMFFALHFFYRTLRLCFRTQAMLA